MKLCVHKCRGETCIHIIFTSNLPNHVHHQDDVEDNEEVVRIPEDLVVEHPANKEERKKNREDNKSKK